MKTERTSISARLARERDRLIGRGMKPDQAARRAVDRIAGPKLRKDVTGATDATGQRLLFQG